MISSLFLRQAKHSLQQALRNKAVSHLRLFSFINLKDVKFKNELQSIISKPKFNLFITNCRMLSVSAQLFQESDVEANVEEKAKPVIDPSKDRTQVISPETSIRYLKSKAYKTTYGDESVWVKYRRNFKGQFIPRKTRNTCIMKGMITTGSPCPICRDEYLVLHYTNIDLLKQFINPYTGEILSTRKTHICRKRLMELEVAIKIAKDYGLMTFEVPFRKFDYAEYYPNWKE